MAELEEFKRMYKKLGIQAVHCQPEPEEGKPVPENALHGICDTIVSTNYWFDREGTYLGRTANGELILRGQESQLLQRIG